MGYTGPPRPASNGYEWVWFPEGYWAERERMDRTVPSSPSAGNATSTGFRWRKRSGKTDSSSRETEYRPAGSLLSPKISPKVNPMNHQQRNSPSSPPVHMGQYEHAVLTGRKSPIPIPYLTEAGHVRSLQRPTPPISDSDQTSEHGKTSRPLLSDSGMFSSSDIARNHFSLTSGPLRMPEHSGNTTQATMSVIKPPSKQPGRCSLIVKPMRSFMGLLPRSKSVLYSEFQLFIPFNLTSSLHLLASWNSILTANAEYEGISW
ncbi:hypothetical protein BX600DRAFT_429194 [Xylariales sp. PMI_506]|nr:hypothetical protein BX600DRAFT_429194 [Xylariales sp. PMI_506]